MYDKEGNKEGNKFILVAFGFVKSKLYVYVCNSVALVFLGIKLYIYVLVVLP